MLENPKRAGITVELCEGVVRRAEYTEQQDDGRIRHYGFVPELGKYLRVVILEDGETVHNAMPDRNFAREQERER